MRPHSVVDHLRGVADVMDGTRRWNGFVCPSCRRVFRVASDYDGKGVVCPACRRMLRLPEGGEEAPPLVTNQLQQHRKSRRSSRKRRSEKWDGHSSGKDDPMIARLLFASILSVVLVVVAALLWPNNKKPVDATGSTGSITIPESTVANDRAEEDNFASLITTSFVEKNIEPVIKGFMEAESLGDAVQWVRNPDVVRPKMEAYYDGGFEPLGYKSISWNEIVSDDSGWVMLRVEVEGFKNRYVYVVKEQGAWKVDWESFVGWSDKSWDEIKQEKPEEPFEIRAILKAEDYYNFDFTDEDRWACFTLLSQDRVDQLYAYVPRDSEMFIMLNTSSESEERRVILSVRFPEESASNNQLLIEDVVSDNWLNIKD